MSDEQQRKVPEGVSEKRADPNVVMTAVNTAAAVVNTGLALYQAHQSGKPKEPPKKD